MKEILVTGAAGFIGSNFVQMLLKQAGEWEVVILDALTYAGNIANLKDCCDDAMYEFVKGDICDQPLVDSLMEGIDVIVNFAAETHVDRSIMSSEDFIRTNIEGVRVLADAALKHKVRRIIHISTDEVYGSLGKMGYFTEDTPLKPNSPYSASKAAADLLLLAYHHTYGLPVVITRASNNYGPYQFPEKLIPLFITNLLEDKKVPVYGDGMQVRDWLHVEDHCKAIMAAIDRGREGQVYNIGARNEHYNLEVTRAVLEYLGKDESYIEHITDRPGHDRRYAIDPTKANTELCWQPQVNFKEGLRQTIEWYKQHQDWWRQIKSGEYMSYYQRQYGSTEPVK
jgi:dTDP-glucose 4,6-dehydratase